MPRGTSVFALMVVLFAAVAGARADQAEVALSNEELKKLDTFEAHVLAKADKVFGQKDYKRAAAEYDSFLLEFPRSRALPYALLRKGRSLHLLEKRFEAIKEYNELLDYFPDAVKYAAAALYYIGLCHWENADEPKAMKAWADMAEDVDYSKHYLAAHAINQLADNLMEQGKASQAIEYFQQVAVDFRKTNRDAARYAIGQVVPYLIRTKPDEASLRAFYTKVGTFHGDPRPVDGDLAQSRAYWDQVRANVKRHGEFNNLQDALKEQYYRYWAGAMDGKFRDWDDFQIDVAAFRREYEKDLAKWMERLDRQFEQYQKKDDYDRVVRWIDLYAGHKQKLMTYYTKLDFAKMSDEQTWRLLLIAYDKIRDPAMGKNVFRKLDLAEMPDPKLVNVARNLWWRDGSLVKDVCMSLKDRELGQAELLRFYHWGKDAKRGLPVAEQLIGVPRFAQEAHWKKGELLEWSKKYREAITAFQLADNPPDNLWKIAHCYVKLGKLEQAIQQLREVEAFFKDHAPEAALRIAHLFRDADRKKSYIASLRGVMKKYPESHQSSQAHQELERLGIKIGGGIDAH
jgi:TolA-binding protein